MSIHFDFDNSTLPIISRGKSDCAMDKDLRLNLYKKIKKGWGIILTMSLNAAIINMLLRE